MRFFGSIIFCLSFLLFSCNKIDNSVSSNDNSNLISNISTVPTIVPLGSSFEILQKIDGRAGGSINFDTTFVNLEGDSVTFEMALRFLPGAFTGIQEISVIPSFDSCSISLHPSMTFIRDVFLNLSFKGIDLSKLGFDSNSKVNFVYIANDGSIEYIYNDECKINWLKSLIYVKNAKLGHFSRYVFVR